MSLFCHSIQQRVAEYIRSQHLLPPLPVPMGEGSADIHVYVGLSGGPDSVCLLHILHQLGYHCHALHCNFQLRGDESLRDEQFCRQLCHGLGIDLAVRTFDTRAYMQAEHLSLEMSARQLRYQWWAGLTPLTGQGYDLALAHHLDDSIETLLMNLMRGTGIDGLTGIVPSNAATHVIRPLLCLSRRDILQYLDEAQIAYVTDSTNLECDTLRNQVRLRLLPLMEELLPQARTGIASTIRHLQSTSHWAEAQLLQYDALTRRHRQWGIEWCELALPRLSECLKSGDDVESYIHWWSQRYCPPSYRVMRTSRLVYTMPRDLTVLDRCRPTLTIDTLPVSAFTTQVSAVSVDIAPVKGPLRLRRWQTADRIAPLGMHGHTRLVSDLLTEAHCSPMQKLTAWLVTDADDRIIWVPGLRVSESCRVTSATSQVLRLQLSESTL